MFFLYIFFFQFCMIYTSHLPKILCQARKTLFNLPLFCIVSKEIFLEAWNNFYYKKMYFSFFKKSPYLLNDPKMIIKNVITFIFKDFRPMNPRKEQLIRIGDSFIITRFPFILISEIFHIWQKIQKWRG